MGAHSPPSPTMKPPLLTHLDKGEKKAGANARDSFQWFDREKVREIKPWARITSTRTGLNREMRKGNVSPTHQRPHLCAHTGVY